MARSSELKLPSASAKVQAAQKAFWNESRYAQDADFYTVGYTGRPLEELLDNLVSHGVRTHLDIRQFTVSMYRPEVSKSNLRRAVEERGLLYVHMPELGVPRDIRAKAIQTGSRDIIWDWYDEHVVAQYFERNMHRFLNGMEHPVALMCVELDPHECHRHRLFIALERLGFSGFDL